MTVEIPLTRGYTAIVDDEDADLAELRWYVTEGASVAYATTVDFNPERATGMHRIILARMLGRELSRKEICDHINSIGTDNRRSNLRIANSRLNTANARRRIDNTSGYKGVTYNKANRKWVAQIGLGDSRPTYLGSFTTPEEAHVRYLEEAKKHFGEYANSGTEEATLTPPPREISQPRPRRKSRKPRKPRVLSVEDVSIIRWRVEGGETRRKVAFSYGIDPSLITRIMNGERHSDKK